MTVILIAALCLAAWVLSLYVQPFGPCPRCHGNGIIQRSRAKGRRPPRIAACPRCKGLKRRQRPGSRTVHQLARRVRRYRARQRRDRERTATTTEE